MHAPPHMAGSPCGAGSACLASGSDAETADPMHVESTLGAVQPPGLELAPEVGLHIEQL